MSETSPLIEHQILGGGIPIKYLCGIIVAIIIIYFLYTYTFTLNDDCDGKDKSYVEEQVELLQNIQKKNLGA